MLELPGVIYSGSSQTLKYERITWHLLGMRFSWAAFFQEMWGRAQESDF